MKRGWRPQLDKQAGGINPDKTERLAESWNLRTSPRRQFRLLSNSQQDAFGFSEMKTSCIAHPPQTPLAILRADYLKICEGNVAAALILNQFEYWTNAKLADITQQRKLGKEVDPEPWFVESRADLLASLMGLVKRHELIKGLAVLRQLGLIEVREASPNPYDRTLAYKLAISKINALLSESSPVNSREFTGERPESSPVNSLYIENKNNLYTRAPAREESAPTDKRLPGLIKAVQDATGVIEGDLVGERKLREAVVALLTQNLSIELVEQFHQEKGPIPIGYFLSAFGAWLKALAPTKPSKQERKFCGACKSGYVAIDPTNESKGMKRCECNPNISSPRSAATA